MTTIRRVALFGKLNPTLYKSVEGATVFAKLRGNPIVELTHWFYQLLQGDDSDIHRILRASQVEAARLIAELQRALERLPAGANGIEDLSSDIDTAVERAWMLASVNFGAQSVRSGHLLLAILADKRLRVGLLKSAPQLERINVEQLRDEFNRWVDGSPETASATAASAYGEALAAPGESAGAVSPAALGKAEALKKYTVDLTARARAGEIDPVTGRDDEIRQIIDILMRRRQNNPILTGEAGVGKTAVVEGFALRIAAGEVPPSLAQVELRSLDIGLLQAGASMKGEFEQRLKQLIDEVQHAAKPVILFIDEIHTLVGAGGTAGTGDAANLLKPALARGTLRTVGATTWSEYKKHIEKDPALTRRFQLVQVHEPDEATATAMLRGILTPLEKHHGVTILDEAIRAAVSLSHRYIPARQLPDKAVALLDTAAARVAISQHTIPGALEDAQRRLTAHQDERTLLLREQTAGQSHEEQLAKLDADITALAAEIIALQARWEEERALVAEMVELRAALFKTALEPDVEPDAETTGDGDASCDSADDTDHDTGDATPEPVTYVGTADASKTTEAKQARLAQLQQRLQQCRGERPLVSAAVDEQVVASVVADWTGIPVGNMVRDEARAVIELADRLEQRVIGQRAGLDTIARRIQTARAKLADPGKPVGVFLLCGPSGVGKTETALALAEHLYGGEQNLITINMSEFQESHTVSTLKGAPPGYVGYGEGGVLTEAVRRRPYSVVLLDEIEKAHVDVHEIFFQVFDKGRMEDGEGREIDFRNTVILLTSNVGTDVIERLSSNGAQLPDADKLDAALRPALLDVFPPALLGRLVVVPYLPLAADTLSAIVRLQLERVRTRIERNHGATLDYDDAAIACVLERCHVSESGGRMIDAVLTNTVLPEISRHALEAMMAGRVLEQVRLSAGDGVFVVEVSTRSVQASSTEKEKSA